MIRLHGLTKTYEAARGRKTIFEDLNVTFPTGRTVALLGRNGAGKSTLLRIIAGILDADRGDVTSDGSISWPVGFAGSFHPELTGKQNTRFIARVYGVDGAELSDFVEEFAELGPHFNMPVRTYSSGMKSRLAFGTSMGIDFDHYLVDEVTSVGDANFKLKSEAVFMDRMESRSAIMVTHSLGMVKRTCDMVGLMANGTMRFYDDVEEGIEAHKALIGASDAPDDDDD